MPSGRESSLWSPTIRAPVSVRRQVITIHDASPLDHPEWFRRGVVAQWRTLVRAQVRRSAHIVTVSEFSRGRIVARLGVPDDRVSVVPCGVDQRFLASGEDDVTELRGRLRLPDRFVLFVGSRDPRKNLDLLLEAWATAGLPPDVHLLVAGGSARTFTDTMTGVHPPQVRPLGYVDDVDLPALYAAATVFAFPSHYEGFGDHPLEAMAAGTPVVALENTPAVVEVVDDAARLVPDDSTALGRTLLDLLHDGDAREELARAGRARAAGFTWDRAAELLRGVLVAS